MNTSVKKIAWISGLIGCALGVLILFFYDPAQIPIYPVCPFHRITGLDCPGCGSLRAIHQLLHGNILAAIRFNALLVLSLPIMAWFGFRILRHELKAAPAVIVRPIWLWIYFGAWIAFGVLRDLPLTSLAAH
jgi:hypothetical protein